MASRRTVVMNPPSIPKLSYNPATLLKYLPDYQIEAFEECFPKCKHDHVARHRALVSGNLELEDDAPSSSYSSTLSRYERHLLLRDQSSDFISIPTQGRQLQGVFFLSETGERTIYGADINAWFNNLKLAQEWIDNCGRHHLIHNRDRAFADRSIHYSYRPTHPSEKAQKLPRDHRCHFLNLPREIRDQILGYILIETAPITPEVIVCSWKRELRLPGYGIDSTGHGLNVKSIRVPRSDEHGPYIEIRRVITKPIDATCLRVNRQLKVEGSKLLYGSNHFNCDLTRDGIRESTGVYTLSDNGLPYYHRVWKWGYDTVGNANFMRAVKDLWKYRQGDARVPGYIYCDPFLRFLHTIGPQNSANLRSVSLSGEFGEVHYLSTLNLKCDESCKRVCLVYHLRMYSYFARAYCSGLRKLAFQGPEIGNEWPEDDDLITDAGRISKKRLVYERYLPTLLKSQIWKFPALRDISVNYAVHQGGKMPVPTAEEIRREIKISGVLGYKPAKNKAGLRRYRRSQAASKKIAS